MTIKLIGAFFIFAGCGGFGFAMAASHRREEKYLRQYLTVLEFMDCDLSCRLTPLPQLCRNASSAVTGPVGEFLNYLAEELDAQIAPDVPSCVRAALSSTPELPETLNAELTELGNTLGRFDLPGQLRGLRAAAVRAKLALDGLSENRTNRLRSYQTLGLCAGAALAILFL